MKKPPCFLILCFFCICNIYSDTTQDLFQAVKSGSLKKTSELVSSTSNIDVKDIDGKTPLHYAAEIGYLEIVKLLVASGADINIQNRWGSTPLHLAVHFIKEDIVRFLTEIETINVNIRDKKGWTPIMLAAQKGNTVLTRFIRQCNADITFKNNSGYTLLHAAARGGLVWLVKDLLAQYVNIDVQDDYANTPLYYAIANGQYETVEFLLKKGAQPDIQNIWGTIPLHLTALYKDKQDLAKLLCKQGSNALIKNTKGQTALDIAIALERTEIIALLIDYIKSAALSTAQNGNIVHNTNFFIQPKKEEPIFANLKWKKDGKEIKKINADDEITICADAANYHKEFINIKIYSQDYAGNNFFIEEITSPVKNNKIKIAWNYSHLTDSQAEDKDLHYKYFFILEDAENEIQSHESKTISVYIDFAYKIIHSDGTPLKNETYYLHLPDNTGRLGKTDDQGFIIEKNIPVGTLEIEI